jgi:two-component sensor histidine kinase
MVDFDAEYQGVHSAVPTDSDSQEATVNRLTSMSPNNRTERCSTSFGPLISSLDCSKKEKATMSRIEDQQAADSPTTLIGERIVPVTQASPEEVDMLSTHAINQALTERELFFKQSLKYADDLVRVYEEEKRRRKVLERANRKLITEIAAHREAQRELTKAHQELDQRVRDRTEALSQVNEQLRLEITQRKHAEEQIRASLQEKEVLLSEIHHRVKNNLQIISSLLALQSVHVEDERVLGALKDSQGRIRSMALIHEQLYRSANLSRINFSEYLKDLAKALLQAHSDKAGSIHITTHADHVFLDVARALPCSLVINELVTNSLKHAFPGGRGGEIHIGFSREDAANFTFTVTDNGCGLPEGFDYRSSPSLGLRLVVNLVELQLGGKLSVNSDGGATFHIEFQCPDEC